ncbi:CvpA family protein [Anaerococcus prevotii]|uniref:Uncharacterized protein n=1 Tax=Anaerococcus prevotii ACS-065-V-Col13 TaxID=879305 RepID=F0GVY0_9FIRM|nr:CvpA family protein [Anaerococcus prevotii]EGC82040.1 hypothetical protein HMPREF9290_1056 [Anaerococcus prevotii ACS-065-V-Col13]
MKKTTRFLTIIGGLFRSVVTILFLFAGIFAAFVDKSLLKGFLDLLGFSNISLGFVKPIAIVILVIGFLINFRVARNIFYAGKTGEKNLSNIFFSVLFIVIDLLVLLFIREKLVYIPIAINILVILASILGLAAKSKGLYGQTFKEKGPKNRRGKARRKENLKKTDTPAEENKEKSEIENDKMIDEDIHYSLDFARDDEVHKPIEESKDITKTQSPDEPVTIPNKTNDELENTVEKSNSSIVDLDNENETIQVSKDDILPEEEIVDNLDKEEISTEDLSNEDKLIDKENQ